MRACDAVPQANLGDLARAAISAPEHLLQLNPFLSPESCARLKEGCITWLQFCVLEDKLHRIMSLAGSEEAMPLLIQELQCVRTWDPVKHPEWLVFEAEGMLQIRPVQHQCAEHLHDNPGAVVQLNMGEGKTRVILPMLALSWANGSCVVRLKFLSELLHEAYGYLHSFLTASILNRKLFLHPMQRDVEITPEGAAAMRASLAHCKQVGGLLLVAPEHRASLMLKRDEMWQWGDSSVCAQLDRLGAVPYKDIVDENDVLLSHKYELVYACGEQSDLPSREERVGASQALLHAASKLVDMRESVVRTPGLAVWEESGRLPGAFSGLRLLPNKALDTHKHRLCSEIADVVIRDPPYRLRWLRGHAEEDHLKLCMVDRTVSAPDAMGRTWESLTDAQRSDLLALRGLLAGEQLLHCLSKRHKVDFGVSRLPTARKRLAVPFRAADWPSERSEWAQPDVAILLTQISYYWDGLSHAELVQAVQVLLSQGENAQQAHYEEWLAGSEAAMTQEDFYALDDPCKLDANNEQQMKVFHTYFSHNMATVDFWLAYCVLPQETKMYPSRLAATAWHLADNQQGQVVGFSGTNDNHRLLPFQVHQSDPGSQVLKATNGKMLGIILSNPSYSTLKQGFDPLSCPKPCALWQSLLDFVADQHMDALIDCGALLAGTQMRAAAEYLLQKLDHQRFKGVCFFDSEFKQWVILEARGRCMPRHCSPVAERECFAIFDDARCRGADLKLRQDAVGLVTLGPGLTKDKLMQAAGRMRMLGRGQRLQFAGTQEVTDKLQDEAHLLSAGGHSYKAKHSSSKKRKTLPPPLNSRTVLQWVMANTVQAMMQGVLEHAKKGLHFADSKAAAAQGQPLLQPEQYTLDALYADAWQVREVGEQVCLMALQRQQCMDPSTQQQGSSQGRQDQPASAPHTHLQHNINSSTLAHPHSQQQLLDAICSHSAAHGSGHMVVASHGAVEQCERELQKEEEEEEEQEREVPRMHPLPEKDWVRLEAAIGATSAVQLHACVGLLPLPEVVAAHLQPTSLQTIPWPSSIWCTTNFMHTVSGAGPASAVACLNDYLQHVGNVLLFKDGSSLLLSEREADVLQQLVWQQVRHSSARSSTAPLLLPFCYLRQAVHSGTAPRFLATRLDRSALGAGAHTHVPLGSMVSLQLFHGDTIFCSTSSTDMALLQQSPHFQQLKVLVHRRKQEAEALVSLRGKLSTFPRSHLELASEDMGS